MSEETRKQEVSEEIRKQALTVLSTKMTKIKKDIEERIMPYARAGFKGFEHFNWNTLVSIDNNKVKVYSFGKEITEETDNPEKLLAAVRCLEQAYKKWNNKVWVIEKYINLRK